MSKTSHHCNLSKSPSTTSPCSLTRTGKPM